METNLNRFVCGNTTAAKDFLKDMEHRTENVEKISKEHTKKFSKYHGEIVKNIEKLL
jgi:hypothetical protein